MIGKSVQLGKKVLIPHPELVNLYGCIIGDHTKIAAFVEIGEGALIGKNVKIQAFVFIPSGVTVENNVFIGPHVSFINDRYPKAVDKKGRLQKKSSWNLEKTHVKEGASIGANATILCGVTIGASSIVGAGAVVTSDVSPGSIVVGNPAKPRYRSKKSLT